MRTRLLKTACVFTAICGLGVIGSPAAGATTRAPASDRTASCVDKPQLGDLLSFELQMVRDALAKAEHAAANVEKHAADTISEIIQNLK